MDKFGRTYILQINPASQGQVAGDQVVIRDPFTIEFDIRREELSTASTGRIRVYNLSEPTRRQIYKDPFDTTMYRQVILRAGYGEGAPVIFKGNLMLAASVRNEGSTEVVTEMVVYDGGYDYSNSYIDGLSLAEDFSRKDAIRVLAGRLEYVHLGSVSEFPEVYPRGKSFMGYTMDLIRKETGGNCFVDGEVLHCLKANDCISGGIPLITSETGLLGSPRRYQHLVVCEMLFEPRLVIGQMVQLESGVNRDFNRRYKVVGVEHYGIISGSVGGKCKTKVSLWLGSSPLTVIGNTAVWGA